MRRFSSDWIDSIKWRTCSINIGSKNSKQVFLTLSKSLDVKNRFLVKKSKFEFFDQNLPKNGAWRSQIDFWSRNENFDFSTKNGPWRSKIDFWSKYPNLNFSTKICPKIVPEGLKSIFGQKMKISIFRPKIDPGGEKSIFGQKIEISIFRLKSAQKWCLDVSNRFLVKK